MKAQHSFKKPKKATYEQIGFGIFALGFTLASIITNFMGVTGYVIGGILIALTGLLVYADSNRRKNSTLFAEMDEETFSIRVWMAKTAKTSYKDKLEYVSNSIELKNAYNLRSEKINNYPILVMNDKTGGVFYLPKRISSTDEVTNFIKAYLAATEGKKVKISATDKMMDITEEGLKRDRELLNTWVQNPIHY